MRSFRRQCLRKVLSDRLDLLILSTLFLRSDCLWNAIVILTSEEVGIIALSFIALAAELLVREVRREESKGLDWT